MKSCDFKIKKVKDQRNLIEKPKKANIHDFLNVSPVLKRDKCSSNNSQDFIEKSFYKWVPPHMRELKFIEMKNYEEYKDNSLNSSGLNNAYEKSSNFSNTPPKEKDYLKKSKSQINFKKENNSNSGNLVRDSSEKIKGNEESFEKLNEIKEELKKTRQCNNIYLKKNKELEIKLFEISKAYTILMNCLDKSLELSRNIAKESLMEEYKIKWNNMIDKIDAERRKIDNYLKFKSVFSYRFSELVDNGCKKNYEEYETLSQSIIYCGKLFLLRILLLFSISKGKKPGKNRKQVKILKIGVILKKFQAFIL